MVNLGDIRNVLAKKYNEVCVRERGRVALCRRSHDAVPPPVQIADKILAMILQHATNSSNAICETAAGVVQSLSKYPENIEQLTSIREFQLTVPEKVRAHRAPSLCGVAGRLCCDARCTSLFAR
jgi:hypothetical protein